MNDWRIGVAIAALLVASSPALAQGQRDGGPAYPRNTQGDRPAGAESKGAPETRSPDKQAPSPQRERAQHPERSDGQGAKQNAQRDRGGPETGEHPETGKKGDKQRTKEQSQREQPTPPGKDRAESQQKREPGQAEDRRKGERPASSDAGSGESRQRNGSGPDSRGQDGGTVRLSNEQRVQVRTAFARHRSPPLANLNVAISVGAQVPRTVHLEVVPEEVVVVVPQYRRYRYFVVDDRICVVEPDTYLIVEVIYLT